MKSKIIKILLFLIVIAGLSIIVAQPILQLSSGKAEQVSKQIISLEREYEQKGILQMGDLGREKSRNLIIDVYYKERYCADIAKKVSERFEDVNIRELKRTSKFEDIDLEFGMAIIYSGNKKYYLTEQSSCSEQILTSYLCELLVDVPVFCNKQKIQVISAQTILSKDDLECFETCFLEFMDNDRIIHTIWHGYPCDRINSFQPGISYVSSRRCLEDDCSDNQDRACCTKEQCIYDGKCYSTGEIAEGAPLACLNVNQEPVWIDPDQDENFCKKSGLHWNGYFCCGDEKDEFYSTCQGSICKPQDSVCCSSDGCVYENTCYEQGCNKLLVGDRYEQWFCDGSTWIDPDSNSGICKECINDDSWAGSFCCGDESNEGKKSAELIINQNNQELSTGVMLCRNKETDCVSFQDGIKLKAGCYPIGDSSYYCKKGKWYEADSSQEDCSSCGGTWLNNECCGDDSLEYFKQDSQFSQCCPTETSIIKNGICETPQICGNNILEPNEKCDPPSEDSISCLQEQTCEGRKTGLRDSYGDCENCKCIYDDYEFSCIKDSCGAECSDNLDCENSQICTSNCQCRLTTLLDICPVRNKIYLNKKSFSPGDTFMLTVSVVDSQNKSMPNIELILDLFIDSEPVSSGIYSTNEDSLLILEKEVTTKTEPGEYRYLIKTVVEGCPTVSSSIVTNFIIEAYDGKFSRPITAPKRNTLVREWGLISELQIPECGNDDIEIGEMCEGNTTCRISLGCDYTSRTYDKAEFCYECLCPNNIRSNSDSLEYCTNCRNCGDSVVNCGELCDNESIFSGLVCVNDLMYNEYQICDDCKGYETIVSDIVADACLCQCSQPQENCIEGNFIEYPSSYYAGCSEDECNSCECEDIYNKDSDSDGIEDKCSQEICQNNIDDNDNGIIDEDNCLWYYCSQCGSTSIKACEKEECLSFAEGCYFEEAFFGFGFCSACSQISSCEEYYYGIDNCNNDPCNINSCIFTNGECCTDTDSDWICDYEDNCLDTSNPTQQDLDLDGIGDECDEE